MIMLIEHVLFSLCDNVVFMVPSHENSSIAIIGFFWLSSRGPGWFSEYFLFWGYRWIWVWSSPCMADCDVKCGATL